MTASGPRLVRPDGDPSPDAMRDVVGALFREHYAELCGFVARYVRSRDVAEEVVQEIFLRVWEQCEAEGAVLPTRAYLYAAGRNQAINLLRHERVVRRHVARQPSQLEPVALAPSADAALEADEFTRAARRAIAGLPDRAQLVFRLSRERGLSYAEIAAVLGVSVKTVEASMARALKRLRLSLDALGAVGLMVHMTLRLLG